MSASGYVNWEQKRYTFDEKDSFGLLDWAEVYDRLTQTKVLWIDNCTHQMFGGFRGFIILDDGTKLELTGKELISFAEHVVNNW